MQGVRAVLFRESRIYRRRLAKHLASYTVSPLLFMLVFGWGVGRHVEMEGMSYLAFMIPGLATMASMTQSYGMATEINISRFYWKVFDEFQMAPISPWEIALGEVLYGMWRGTVAGGAVYLMALLFGADLSFTWAAVPIFALHVFTFASAAVVAAMVVRGHADQGHINTFFIVPMSFLCGTFFPLESLPGWAEAAARCLPLTHSNIAIRGSLFEGRIDWPSLVILALFGIGFFYAGVRAIRRATI